MLAYECESLWGNLCAGVVPRNAGVAVGCIRVVLGGEVPLLFTTATSEALFQNFAFRQIELRSFGLVLIWLILGLPCLEDYFFAELGS